MHTVIVIAVGLLILAGALVLGHTAGGAAGAARAALWFLPVWLLGAALNMHIGVSRAGYAIGDEAPVFLLVFAAPAALALLLWRRLAHR